MGFRFVLPSFHSIPTKKKQRQNLKKLKFRQVKERPTKEAETHLTNCEICTAKIDVERFWTENLLFPLWSVCLIPTEFSDVHSFCGQLKSGLLPIGGGDGGDGGAGTGVVASERDNDNYLLISTLSIYLCGCPSSTCLLCPFRFSVPYKEKPPHIFFQKEKLTFKSPS